MKNKIPFFLLPGAWGLKGKTREIAEAEYYYTGYELEKKLLEIHKNNYSDDDYIKKSLDLDLHHNKITTSEFYRKSIDLIKDEDQKALAFIELDYKEGKLDKNSYEKTIATHKKEPWVNVISFDYDSNTTSEGSFELDWNDHFLVKLKKEGYTGHDDESIVNQWFMTICKNIAEEEFIDSSLYPDVESNLETFNRFNLESSSKSKSKK